MSPTHYLIGSAYGFGAGNIGCGDGPSHLKAHLEKCAELGLNTHWHEIVSATNPGQSVAQTIAALNKQIAQASQALVEQGRFPTNIGGDHSCAIGMWSGIASAKRAEGDIGLIWVDAHLDAHTPETTPTGNIHGMPVAALLGYGEDHFTKISDDKPKLKPENLVFLGARSYESGEHALLEKLGVTIYYMEDLQTHGFDRLFKQAVDQVSKRTIGYGLSFDLDGIDPIDAPGVGTPVDNGIHAQDVINCFKDADFSKLIGLEIVEYNPHLDQDNKTLNILIKLLQTVYN